MAQERVLVLGTFNRNKVRELARSPLLRSLPVRIKGLYEYADAPDPEETGKSFAANAALKARHAALHTGQWALADDSGLEVDALDGKPGIYSARFSGPAATDRSNNEKLLQLLKDVPPERRTARFRCAIAIASPTGIYWVDEAACEGMIAEQPAGDGGFGYDPLFIVPEYGQTFAQLPPEVKDEISHRARALQMAVRRLKKLWAFGPNVI